MDCIMHRAQRGLRWAACACVTQQAGEAEPRGKDERELVLEQGVGEPCGGQGALW